MSDKPKRVRTKRPGIPYKYEGKWWARVDGKKVELKATTFDEAMSELHPDKGAIQAWTAAKAPNSVPATTSTAPSGPPQAIVNNPGLSTNVLPAREASPEVAKVAGPGSVSTEAGSGLHLSEIDKQRFHGLMSGIVTRLNVVIVGGTIKIFGRQPAEPDDADIKFLEKAWEAQLSQWFETDTVPPWVLILSASLAMGVGMYFGGTALPKADTKTVQTPSPENVKT